MSTQKFRSTKVIVRCLQAGTHMSDKAPAVPPKIEEKPVGTVFAASDFTEEDFTTFFKDGTLVATEKLDGDDEAASYYRAAKPVETTETEAQRKERLINEAKLLGIDGITKSMKIETIEAKIAEHKSSGKPDETPPADGGAADSGGKPDETSGEAEGSAGDEDVIG